MCAPLSVGGQAAQLEGEGQRQLRPQVCAAGHGSRSAAVVIAFSHSIRACASLVLSWCMVSSGPAMDSSLSSRVACPASGCNTWRCTALARRTPPRPGQFPGRVDDGEAGADSRPPVPPGERGVHRYSAGQVDVGDRGCDSGPVGGGSEYLPHPLGGAAMSTEPTAATGACLSTRPRLAYYSCRTSRAGRRYSMDFMMTNFRDWRSRRASLFTLAFFH